MSSSHLPSTATAEPSPAIQGNDLESILARIHQIADKGTDQAGARGATSAGPSPAEPPPVRKSDPAGAAAARAVRTTPSFDFTEEEADGQWRPMEPQSLKAAGLSEGQVEHLVLKCLNACGDLSGRDLSEQHAIPFRLLAPVLQEMK